MHKGLKRTERLSKVTVSEMLSQFGTRSNAYRNLKLAEAGISFKDFEALCKTYLDPIKTSVVEELWDEYKKKHNLTFETTPEMPRATRTTTKRRQDKIILELNKRPKPFKFTEE